MEKLRTMVRSLSDRNFENDKMKKNSKNIQSQIQKGWLIKTQTIIGLTSRNAEPAFLRPQKQGALSFSEQ
jgi:hypothetical protein